MNTESPTLQILCLVLVLIIVTALALAMKKHATTPKHRLALVAPLTLPVVVPLGLLTVTLNPIIAVLITVGAVALMGLIWILTPQESSDLYSRLRNDGGIWRWIVNETPKKESFILRGWVMFLIGLGGFAMIMFRLAQLA